MRRPRLALALVSVMVFALSGIGGVLADHELDPAISHIVVDFPGTYGSCVDEITSDVISITNVNAPGDPSTLWTLQGTVTVQYITETGREVVPGGVYSVNNQGDLTLEIFYPPVSDWPVFTDPTTGQPVAELHIDVQLEVLNEFGVKVGEIGIGPGHDWDIFCLTPPTEEPPPPPPPPTGTEGCTPGYWKTHLTAWADTPFSPDDLYGTVFGVTATGNPTLEEAAGAGGGGEYALFRHATAALLNASIDGVDYAYTPAEVIEIVQNAYATGDFETAKNQLAAANEKGCSLQGYDNTQGGGSSNGNANSNGNAKKKN